MCKIPEYDHFQINILIDSILLTTVKKLFNSSKHPESLN